MTKTKPFLIHISENTTHKKVSAKYNGHIVECHDVDSGDVFPVHVLIIDTLDSDQVENEALKAASKSHLVKLSGNSFDFEYLQPSGESIEIERYTLRTQLSDMSEEAKSIMEKYIPG